MQERIYNTEKIERRITIFGCFWQNSNGSTASHVLLTLFNSKLKNIYIRK